MWKQNNKLWRNLHFLLAGYKDVVEILALRFDLSQVDRLKSNIESIEELQTLNQLLRSAVQVAHLDEFKRILDSVVSL